MNASKRKVGSSRRRVAQKHAAMFRNLARREAREGHEVRFVRHPDTGRTICVRTNPSPPTATRLDDVVHRLIYWYAKDDAYRPACRDEWWHRSDFDGDGDCPGSGRPRCPACYPGDP